MSWDPSKITVGSLAGQMGRSGGSVPTVGSLHNGWRKALGDDEADACGRDLRV